MTESEKLTQRVGITCPNCDGRMYEWIERLFTGSELSCSHCGKVIDIGSGEIRDYIVKFKNTLND